MSNTKQRALSNKQAEILELYSSSEWKPLQNKHKQSVISLCKRNLLEYDPSIGPDGSVRDNPSRKTIQHAIEVKITRKDGKGTEFKTTASYEGYQNKKSVTNTVISKYLRNKDLKSVNMINVTCKNKKNGTKTKLKYFLSDFEHKSSDRRINLMFNLTDEQYKAREQRRSRTGTDKEFTKALISQLGYSHFNINPYDIKVDESGFNITVSIATRKAYLVDEIEYIFSRLMAQCIAEYREDPHYSG